MNARRAAASAVLVLGLAVAARAQTPSAQSAPVPAIPDTATAAFSWAGEGPSPRAIHSLPSQSVFGDRVLVVMDFDTDAQAVVDSLRVDVDWLEPGAERVDVPDVNADLAALPKWSGDRLVVPCRIYRVGPWRASWREGATTSVGMVTGRVANSEALVPVRDPRHPGGAPVWLLILAALAIGGVVIWLLLRRWRRRDRPQPTDRTLPLPAWLAAALALRDLERIDPGRAYLDVLAGILRRFVSGRFLLNAEEMAAEEILDAAVRSGWPRPALRGFARLLVECDKARYAPSVVSATSCRDRLRESLDLIETARIQPTYSPVPERLRQDAAAAWQALRAAYPRQESVAGRSSC